CWPMYAAMPAILKKAMHNAYESCNWDMIKSENRHGYRIFPDFSDVLREIRLVVEESDYSADNKSDYTGSLVTRVESLTTGIFGMVFQSNGISDADLFDKNVIVDLSSIGSSETKSMIMGILILKLQEYRMSQEIEANALLQHITVLEEAHHLLKRTSTEQAAESSNLLGKAVEMLTNAIAEMRTYGEGFIIADQSPGLLDMAVIRNTNTKIIHRLPDYSDRELVGYAAGLNKEQIKELAKLEKGVAVIRQSDWLDSVLCKVDEYKNPESVPREKIDKSGNDIHENSFQEALLCLLLNKNNPEELKKYTDEVLLSNLNGGVKSQFLNLIARHTEEQRMENWQKILYDVFGLEKMMKKVKDVENNPNLVCDIILKQFPVWLSDYDDSDNII
ncbi:MAG: ATP-binding protein, partial [Oscillospiraceae bacterium]|nr:ATP-binding protein [Oscillospiraceae bacterium]